MVTKKSIFACSIHFHIPINEKFLFNCRWCLSFWIQTTPSYICIFKIQFLSVQITSIKAMKMKNLNEWIRRKGEKTSAFFIAPAKVHSFGIYLFFLFQNFFYKSCRKNVYLSHIDHKIIRLKCRSKRTTSIIASGNITDPNLGTGAKVENPTFRSIMAHNRTT